MTGLKIGDIVARKSYGMDVFFKVCGFKTGKEEGHIELKGINYRILADAPENDLVSVPYSRLRELMDKGG